ncbi:TonB-dependent receptor [candidate division KSB1 bacterium]|nr:TonB-dependent receptor [candidate division KSB1 bacterium]
MNSCKKRLFILFFSLSAVVPHVYSSEAAKSRTGVISGLVVDRNDSTALPHVNVILENTMLGSSTDLNGYFIIKGVPPGEYNLFVLMMGYRTMLIHKVQVYPGQTRKIYVRLRPKVLELGGVQVTADRATQMVDQERSLAGHEVITPRLVINKAGAFEDAYRAMITLPSVSSRNDLNTQLYVRGGSPDQNLVLFEGIEILNPSRLFVVMGGGVSVVNPDIIQAIDLAPGGFEVNYGNKMSALMQINTREGRRDKTSVGSSVSLINARTVAEGPFADGRGSWLVAARRSFYDLLANRLYSQNYVFPYFYDLHAKVAYNLSVNSKLSAFYSRLGEGAQLFDFESESLDLLNKGKGHIAGLRFNSIINPQLAVNLLAGFYTDQNNIKVYDTFNYAYHAKLNYGVERTTLRGDLHYYPFEWLLLRTGTQTQFLKTDLLWNVDWRNYLQLPDGLLFHSNYVQNSSYWQVRYRNQRWFELTTGLRYDYSSLYNEVNWSPRCKFVFAPQDNITFWYNIGLFSQFPDILTIISRGEPLDITQNTSELNSERSLHNIIGVSWESKNRSMVKAEVYSKNFDQLLMTENEITFSPVNTGLGTAQGFEFTYQFRRMEEQRFGFWVNYAYSETKYKRSRTDKWVYFDYDQRHQFATGLEWRLSKRWNVSGVWRFGSGFPYTPIKAMKKNMDASDGPVDGWEFVKEEKNSARYPNYSRIDLRLAYSFNTQAWGLSAYVDFINLLNHPNVYQYEWDFYLTDGGTKAIGSRTTVYMVPFIPSFGLSFHL